MRGLDGRILIEGFYDTVRELSDAEKLGGEPDAKAFDGVLMVDKLTGVYLSKTIHREDQPSHIIIHDPELCARPAGERP